MPCFGGAGPVVPGEPHPGGGSIDLALQHGINSSGDTWCPFIARLRGDFYFNRAHKWSTPWWRDIGTQVSVADGGISGARPAGGPTWIAGHSQGGLVSRSLAGRLYVRDGGVRGVVTIDSPNQGAPLANAATLAQLAAYARMLENLEVCDVPWFSNPYWPQPYCFRGGHPDARRLLTFLGVMGLTAEAEFIRDVQPGSIFVNQMNAVSEPYRRASVSSAIPQEFAFWRILGESGLGGVAGYGYGWQQFAEAVFFTYMVIHFVCHLEREGAIESRYIGGYCASPAYYAYLVFGMAAIDLAWADLTGSELGGDGFIPATSQRYPQSPGSPDIGRFGCDHRVHGPATCDSHVGNTQGRRTYDDFRKALELVGLPPRRDRQ